MIMSDQDESHAAAVEAVLEEVLDVVFVYRCEGLRRLGFNRRQRQCLAFIPDIVHEAERLIGKGCPIDTAFDLLSE